VSQPAGTPIAWLSGVQNQPKRTVGSRWRPLPWLLGGAGVAAACLALGTLASSHWSTPEPGVIPATGLNALDAPPEPQALEATDPSLADPSAPLIPWAWLDQPARPEPLLSASDPIASAEVERVAGRDSADAGAVAAVDGGAATLSQLESEAPDTAPEDPESLPPGEACGFVTCAPGYGCCNASCGVCVRAGDNCDPTPCESRIQTPESDVCGRSTCSKGQFCCNPSCGICVSPGESCDQAPCDNAIQYPFSPICGRATCSVGKVCCNPSCGICVEPGETCSQQPCEMP
jgi:hypothetical protein